MAEASADTRAVDDEHTMEDFVEVTVLSTGQTFEYIVPSFPVYKAMLREVKWQREEFETETIHVFDESAIC